MTPKYFVDPDISQAETLPADFYTQPENFDLLKENLFKRSWHYVGDRHMFPFDGHVVPIELLPGCLSQPILLVKEGGKINCLSNVCTHRANILVHHPGRYKKLQCIYHGRRFDLKGQFEHMPEFENVQNFPRPCDHLKNFETHLLDPLIFINLEPHFAFNQWIKPVLNRIDFLPLDQFKLTPERNKEYLINCHWALYCDNYLEGFHIPFVHQGLNAVLDYGSYTTELFPYAVLQIGRTKEGEESFDLPEGHPDYGQNIAAYYFWLFPNLMLNFYPWGLSINIVKPINPNKTRVSFITYVFDESKLDQGAGAALDKVEREDEFVVEGVHKGIQSIGYTTGRFSPTREKGVHHFHRLLASVI